MDSEVGGGQPMSAFTAFGATAPSTEKEGGGQPMSAFTAFGATAPSTEKEGGGQPMSAFTAFGATAPSTEEEGGGQPMSAFTAFFGTPTSSKDGEEEEWESDSSEEEEEEGIRKITYSATLTREYFDAVETAREAGTAFSKKCREEWHLGSYARWNLDSSVGDLVFTHTDGSKAVCTAQIFGTYSYQSSTFLWSWANLNPVLPEAAEYAKQYGETHDNFEPLTAPQVPCSENWSWDLAYLAAYLNGKKDNQSYGVYRGRKDDPGCVFIMFSYPREVVWHGDKNLPPVSIGTTDTTE